jgi:hypothetical protein
MIFVDESGKRWRAIKRSFNVLSSTVALPVVGLAAAALFYLPNWGNLSLPKPETASSTSTTSLPSPAVLSAISSHVRSDSHSPQTSTTGAPTSSSSTGSQASSLSPNSAAPVATSSTPTTPTTTAPTPTNNGLSNKPTDPGNSAYGQEHRPTRP